MKHVNLNLKRRFINCLWIVLIAASFSGVELQAQGGVGHYILQMRDEPVVTHLSHQSAVTSLREKLLEDDAATYRTQLLTRQMNLRRSIESLPEARVEAQVDTVFNGLAVSLRPEDAASLKQYPEVKEIFESIEYHKAIDAALPLADVPQAWTNPKVGGEDSAGAGVRIAVIDTGIDVSHPMLQDTSLTPPSGFPRFATPTPQCNNSDERFTNSKVIVARNYVSLLANPDQNCDAEDRDGHGTFVSAVAAGRRVTADLASISGVAPKAFLGSYKVFGTPGTNDGASTGAILKALDDAVKDGMNVINLSMEAATSNLPSFDPLALAIANAVDAGATVVVAAGNAGPKSGTVGTPGIAPAAITVGATTNSRKWMNSVTITADVPIPELLQPMGARLGNGTPLTSSVGPAPLVDVSTVDGSGDACSPIPAESLSGKLVLIRRGGCNFFVKIQNAAVAKAVAAIVYNDQSNRPPVLMDVQSSTQIPSAMIGNSEGLALAQLLAIDGGSVQGTLDAQVTAMPLPPNQIASFTSNGPSTDFCIKPDLVAPGTNIYSATQRNYTLGGEYDSSGFTISDGTSFSSPLVAGLVALVKQTNPTFTPAQIKSTVVNTAAKVVTASGGGFASVLSQGNGLVDASAALNTHAIVSPVSITFGARPQAALAYVTKLSVVNVGAAAETFSVTVTPAAGSANVTLSVSPSTLKLAAGASAVVTVNAQSSEPVSGTFEGYISIQSQEFKNTITVPYWGLFLPTGVKSADIGSLANSISLSRAEKNQSGGAERE